jgi:hypothetical protein
LIQFLLSSTPSLLVAESYVALPHGAQVLVPESEKWLRKVGLNPPTLVVNVVVSRIIGCDMLQRVKRQCVAAVVIHSLDGRSSKEPNGLPDRHTSD